MKLKGVFEMSDERRQRLRPPKEQRKYAPREKRKFSREQLLEYLRTHGFRSAGKLDAGRKPGEPKSYDYRKEFGNWENARTAAFGIREMEWEFDAPYFLKTITQLKLWSLRAYMAKRKVDPVTLPSLYRIKKKWGRWGTMKAYAIRSSFKSNLEEYSRLRRKLGRIPTMDDVKAAGLSIETAIAYYKTKQELDRVMESWKGSDEGETGSP